MTDLTIRLDQLDALAGLLPATTPPRTVADIARWGIELPRPPREDTITLSVAAELDDSKLSEHLAWLTERMAYGASGRPAMLAEGAAPRADAEEPRAADTEASLPPRDQRAEERRAPRPRHLPGGVTEWTDDEKQLLERMWAEGASLADISAALPGRTVRSVGEKRRKIGLPARAGQPVEQGAASAATAADAALTPEAVTTEDPEQAPKVAPVVPEVAPAVPEVAPARMPPAGLSNGAARIFEAMAALDDSFAPDDDKLLVEQRYVGAGFPGIAEELGCDEETAKARWRAILKCRVQNKGGILTQKGWADLRAAVARRAAEAEA